MKNTFTFLVLFACMLNVSYAQDEKITLGIKGGLNIASISNTGSASVTIGNSGSSYKNKPKLLPHFGAYSEIKVSEIFSVQPELLFSMKGYGSESKVKTSSTNSSETDYSLTLSYLEIPVQMRFNLGKGFHLLGGPYVGFLLAANSKTKSEVVNGSTTVVSKSSSTSKSNLSSTDVGMYLGMGYELENGLSFGLRWCKGFTDITPLSTSSGILVVNTANTNSVFQFSVGYKLAGF